MRHYVTVSFVSHRRRGVVVRVRHLSGLCVGPTRDRADALSSTIRRVRVVEISLNDHYPVAAVMQDGMGFGRSLDFEPFVAQPGIIPRIWRAPIQLIAQGLGIDLDDIKGQLDRVLTDRDLDVAFGTIPAGTVGAVRMVASGIVDQHEAIVVEHVIRMARDVAPDWPASDSDATYLVSIEGVDIDVRLSLGEAEGHGAGNSAMTATAMRVVNAVPYVVEAAPGLLSSLYVPLTVPQHAL